MDAREVKTLRSIHNSFLELRSKKDLEKITVKELCELAEISKATFYLHYNDIYDLSETLQKDVASDIVKHITDPEELIYDSPLGCKKLIESFYAHRGMIEILFRGSQFSRLTEYLEAEIKELIFGRFPELRNDAYANCRLTYQLMGSFYAFYRYEKSFGYEAVMESVERISDLFTLPKK